MRRTSGCSMIGTGGLFGSFPPAGRPCVRVRAYSRACRYPVQPSTAAPMPTAIRASFIMENM